MGTEAEGAGEFNLRRVKKPVFESFEQLERELQERTQRIEAQRESVLRQRDAAQRRREELVTLRAELERQRAAAVSASYGLLACFYKPPNLQKIEADSRKERRREIANYATFAFEAADDDDDRELTVEELRRIEGDNAETVMREADVDGSGTLSKREYVNYKMHVAKQVGKLARKAFKAADINDDGDLTLEQLREIEGDNAEKVMREADVDGGGTLSKREYVDYKMRVAARGAAQH